MTRIAVILIRGREVGIRHDTKRAMDALRLLKKHVCAVVDDSPLTKGQLDKVKDFTTFGPITEETYQALKKKGSRKDSEGKELDVFNLAPPIGGFERRGVKSQYQNGGVLGLRRTGMDALIKKMLR